MIYKNFISGTLTLDLVATIKHFMKGIKYNMQVDPYDESLGLVEMKIGYVSYIVFSILQMNMKR